MFLVALSFGLRRSEIFALQWWDFDFERNKLSVMRKIYGGKLGECKTKASRADLPMPRSVAIALCVWRKFTPYKRDSDWLFPSIRTKGVTPLDPKDRMNEVIRPAAKLAGIDKPVHWHAFRYTYGSWLIANGVDIGTVHELMRHASPRTTLEFYIKARKKLKIRAQDGIERLLFPGAEESSMFLEDSEVPGHIKEKQKRDALKSIASLIFGGEESGTPSDGDVPQMDDDDQDTLM
jgi:integrase